AIVIEGKAGLSRITNTLGGMNFNESLAMNRQIKSVASWFERALGHIRIATVYLHVGILSTLSMVKIIWTPFPARKVNILYSFVKSREVFLENELILFKSRCISICDV